MTDEPATNEKLAALESAMAMVRKISDKVDRLFAPLVHEMKVMNWPTEYQAIMWEAVMLDAKARWEKCGE